MLDSDHELELERMRLTSGCMRMAGGDLGAALKSEIQRLAGGQPADQESARKHELACLRMAADCMQLVAGDQGPRPAAAFPGIGAAVDCGGGIDRNPGVCALSLNPCPLTSCGVRYHPGPLSKGASGKHRTAP